MSQQRPTHESLTPYENPFPEQLSEIVAHITEGVVEAAKENAAAKVKIAEIELPLKQKQLDIQADQIKNYHEAQTLANTSFFGKLRREFWFQVMLAFVVIVFMMFISGYLIVSGDKTNGMTIIGLLIGLVSGFAGGAGWQKTRGSGNNTNQNDVVSIS